MRISGWSSDVCSSDLVTQSLAVIPIETAAPGEWRQGRLEYENSRLADLVADVNRYYAPGVELDESARDVRVTASFRADRSEERSVGNACVSTCRSRWWPCH